MTQRMWSVSKHVCVKKTRVSELNKLVIDQGKLINAAMQSCNCVTQHGHWVNSWQNRERDMDFKNPGPLRSTVKQSQSANVRRLIQKIENHPHRHALQRELQQSQSLNPFSQESKQMIHGVGNFELCELLDTEPKTQCKVCLSYWDIGIVYVRALLKNKNRGK